MTRYLIFRTDRIGDFIFSRIITDAIKNPNVLAQYQKSIDGFNPEFSHIEQVKKFALLNTTWDAVKEDGSKAELTPTMKLKRRVILEKYQSAIDGIYENT